MTVVLVVMVAMLIVCFVTSYILLLTYQPLSHTHPLPGSAYIRDLATLVVAYGISINLVEVSE